MWAHFAPVASSSDPTMRGRRPRYASRSLGANCAEFRPDYEGTAIRQRRLQFLTYSLFRPDYEGTATAEPLSLHRGRIVVSDPTVRGRRPVLLLIQAGLRRLFRPDYEEMAISAGTN